MSTTIPRSSEGTPWSNNVKRTIQAKDEWILEFEADLILTFENCKPSFPHQHERLIRLEGFFPLVGQLRRASVFVGMSLGFINQVFSSSVRLDGKVPSSPPHPILWINIFIFVMNIYENKIYQIKSNQWKGFRLQRPWCSEAKICFSALLVLK